MSIYLLFLVIIACWQVSVFGYVPLPRMEMIKGTSRSKALIMGQQPITSQLQSTKGSKDTPEKELKFKKYKCQGCAFVYDEEKGFKRRYPPGTKFEPLPTFMCPVCGAAKDQFHEYHED
jgi:rubredoxin|eukprot:gene2199-2341_t